MSEATFKPENLKDRLQPESPSLPLIDDRYECVAKLGEGGFGNVYRAIDRRFGTEVALKLSQEVTSKHAFEREARLMKQVENTHVVRVSDYGVTVIDGNEQHFIVMELLDGVSVEKLLEQNDGQLPDSELYYLAKHLGRALEFCHERGLVHRDLKPDNVLRADCLDAEGQKKCRYVLLDFGIAAKPDDGGILQGKTNDGAGTPGYMAPETLGFTGLRGNIEGQVGPKADVFSFAAVLYKCLTGRRPFEIVGNESLLPELVRVAGADVPPKPSEVHPERGISPELDALLLKCLSKEVDDRPSSARRVARQFCHALAPYLSRRDSDTIAGGASKPAKSNRLMVAVLGLLIAAITALGTSLVVQHRNRPSLVVTGADADAVRTVQAGKELHVGFVLNGLKGRTLDDVTVTTSRNALLPQVAGGKPPTLDAVNGTALFDFVFQPSLSAEPATTELEFFADVAGFDQTLRQAVPVAIEPRVPWQPPGHDANPNDLLRKPSGPLALASDGTPLAETIKVLVPELGRGGDLVTFIRIRPEDAEAKPRDFKSFYMMENKVGRDLYRRFLMATDGGTDAEPAFWATDRAGDPTTIRWPATGIELAEAQRFAQWLGGLNATLPSVAEWHAAAGSYGFGIRYDFDTVREDLTVGPYEAEAADDDATATFRFDFMEPRAPVDGLSKERSRLRVRQLGTNGSDLTRSFTAFTKRAQFEDVLFGRRSLDDVYEAGDEVEVWICRVFGVSKDRMNFGRILDDDQFPTPRRVTEVDGHERNIGFRVVIETDPSEMAAKQYKFGDLEFIRKR